MKRTFCPILLLNNDLDDHEDTFIADLKMDSFDKRPPREYWSSWNVFSKRLSLLVTKVPSISQVLWKKIPGIFLCKKNFQIMNLDLWHLEKEFVTLLYGEWIDDFRRLVSLLSYEKWCVSKHKTNISQPSFSAKILRGKISRKVVCFGKAFS